MKFSYTCVVLLIFQLALNYVKADLGSKDMSCENGTVVQFGSSFECMCHPGHTHENQNKCVKNADVVETCNEETNNKVCGEYAKCTTDLTDPKKSKCACNPGYLLKQANGVDCVVAPCKDKNCGKGVCATDKNNAAVCSCHVNHKNKVEGDKASECVEGGEHTCNLTCVNNAHCQVHENGYFFCECVNKKPMVNGVCSNAITSFLSPFNILLLIGVYIIYLKTA